MQRGGGEEVRLRKIEAVSFFPIIFSVLSLRFVKLQINYRVASFRSPKDVIVTVSLNYCSQNVSN